METYPLIETKWTTYHAVGTDYYTDKILHVITQYGDTQNFKMYHADVTFELIPEPNNEYDPHAISIRKDNYILGYIGRCDTDKYLPLLNRIRASGYIPTVGGEMWYYPSSNSGGLRLRLEEPDCLTPVNEPPAGECFLIPPMRTLKVSDAAEHFDTLFEYLPQGGTGKLLLTFLTEHSTSSRKTPRIAVTVDSHLIGHLSPVASKKVQPILDHFEPQGITVCALATLTGSSLSAEVSVQLSYAHELDDESLEERVHELPRLLAEGKAYSSPVLPESVLSDDEFRAPAVNSYPLPKDVSKTQSAVTKIQSVIEESNRETHEEEPTENSRVHVAIRQRPAPSISEAKHEDSATVDVAARGSRDGLKNRIINTISAVLVGVLVAISAFIAVVLIGPSNGWVVMLSLLMCIALGYFAGVMWYRRRTKSFHQMTKKNSKSPHTS